MEARDPDTGEVMTITLLRNESITMFFAGHDSETMHQLWRFLLLESHLLLAILARRFRPRLRDGFVPHFVMRGTLSIEGGLPAVIETR